MRWLFCLLAVAAGCADTTPPSTAVCDARVWRASISVSYANRVDQLIGVGIIAGVPPQLIAPLIESERNSRHPDYDTLLAEPSMQPQFADPEGTILLPSCSSATASATPPRRLVQFARDFGASAFGRSI